MSSQPHARQFLRGLRVRSPIVLAVALAAVVAAQFGIQALFTSGAFTLVRQSVLLRDPRDDYLHDSYVVGSLKRQAPKNLPIYVIGGSATRESLVSEQSFAGVVRRTTGIPVSAYVLCNMNQTFAQSLAIVDNLPLGPGVVVITVNNNRFHFSPAEDAQQTDGDPFLLASPTLRRFVASTPGSDPPHATLPGILPGVLGYLVGVVDAKVSALAKGQPLGLVYDPHWVTAAKMWSLARKRQGVQQWIATRAPGFFRYYSYNARLLDVLVGRAKQRGFSVVLLEETEDTAVVGHAFDQFKRIYKPIVRGIAAKYGVPYLDLQKKLRLPNSDFWDYIHPVEPARVVWQRVLAAALKPTVQKAARMPS